MFPNDLILDGHFSSQAKFPITESKLSYKMSKNLFSRLRLIIIWRDCIQLIFVYEFTDLANFCSIFFSGKLLVLNEHTNWKRSEQIGKEFYHCTVQWVKDAYHILRDTMQPRLSCWCCFALHMTNHSVQKTREKASLGKSMYILGKVMYA